MIKIPVKHQISPEEDFFMDCPNYPLQQTVLPPVKRIIAIGDIHGDFDLVIKSFKLAKLIDDSYNWVAFPPDTVVVQVGDQIDSCRLIPGLNECDKPYPNDKQDDVKILNFFNEMDVKARKKGGAVYSLLGNHELLNTQGIFSYVSYENLNNFEYMNLKGIEGRKEAFKQGGPISGMMACTRQSVLIIGSNMFVHAGILPKLINEINFIDDPYIKLQYINRIVRKWLLNKIQNTDELNNTINDLEKSPFWTRVLGQIKNNSSINSEECLNSVKKVLEIFKIGNIVVGHTPQFFSNSDGINGTCYDENGNTLHRIDGGFSKAFKIFGNSKYIQVLEIIDDKTFNILTNRI